MSFSEKYDKVALAVGGILGLAGLGVGALTYVNLDETYKVDTAVSSSKVSVPGVDQSLELEAYLNENHEIKRPKVGAQNFDLFVAPELWLKSGDTTPIDINAGPPIHPPIPNTWFLENGLADILRFSDALTQDPDGDGFTIQEEFEAKTNPKDANSHPLLIAKLGLTGFSATGYQLVFSSDDMPPDYTFKALARNGATLWREDVKVDATMPTPKEGKPAVQDPGRFKLKEVTKKEFESKTGIKENESIAIVEDLKPTKAGTIYEIRKGNKYPAVIQDKSVELTISAGPKSGETIKVEEGKTFTIPGDDKTVYTLETVDLKSRSAILKAEIDGKNRTWNLSK